MASGNFTHDVAVLGLGAMGSRMAQRFLDAGLATIVFNRTRSRTALLAQRGADVADTPRAAASAARVVISMLTDDDAARSVWLGTTDGALAAMRPGAVAVDSSTVSPAWIDDFATAAAARAQPLLAAPVVGSRPQAETGQLILLVGGDTETLASVHHVLSILGGGAQGGGLHHVGSPRAAAAMKLAINGYFVSQIAHLAELRRVLALAGVNADTQRAVFASVPTTSPAALGALALMNAGDDVPRFPLDLAAKDLRYALALGREYDAWLPVTRAVQQVLTDAQLEGLGGLNVTVVGRVYPW